MRRLTIDQLRERIRDTGYTLVSTEYVNAHKKLQFITPTGETVFISYDDFKHGHRSNRIYANRLLIDKGSYFELHLTGVKHNGVILFDKEDYDLVMQYKWHINGENEYAMAYRYVEGKRKHFSLHSLLMPNPPKGCTPDHRDRNKLNNRRNNLRYASRREQSLNRSVPSDNKTGRCGVTKDKNGYYLAQIKIKDKCLCKCFNSNKLGEEKAFKLACKQREMWEREYKIPSQKWKGDVALC